MFLTIAEMMRLRYARHHLEDLPVRIAVPSSNDVFDVRPGRCGWLLAWCFQGHVSDSRRGCHRYSRHRDLYGVAVDCPHGLLRGDKCNAGGDFSCGNTPFP